jgi:hypothetical protein
MYTVSQQLGYVNWNVMYAVFLIIWLTFMLWYKLLPSINSFQTFADVINSRGGNIVLLSSMALYFFYHSIRIFYLLIDLSKPISPEGKAYIAQDNAFALMGLQFVTSSAFGGAFGALLKTMTGESSKSRGSDTPGTTVTATSTTVLPPPNTPPVAPTATLENTNATV